ALSAPLLGAIADAGAKRKAFLLLFGWVGAAATLTMGTLPQDGHVIAGLLFILGIVGFLGGNIFYDSMVVDLSRGRSSDKVSAFGYGMGYLGGGLLFAFNVIMVLNPETFGFADKAA